MESSLVKLGMEPRLVQQVCMVLSVAQDLLLAESTRAAQALGNIGVAKLPSELPSENSLVQLLYAYLVQWIGEPNTNSVI